jgi:polysaccharide pyruvyl transferase WcaK-like protein
MALAGWMHKKVFLVSQTIGPLREPLRSSLRRQLAGAEWIGVRDKTYSGCQVGLPVHFAADDAVFLTPEHDAATSALVRTHERMIGMSFGGSRWMGACEPLRMLTAVEEVVSGLAATPVFIPHFAHGRHSDLKIARLIEKEWHSKPVILERVPSAPAILALTGKMLLVMASRYHAVIFALAAGVPAVALYFDEYTKARMTGAFEQFELEPFMVDMMDTGHGLGDAASKAIDNRARFYEASLRVKRDGLKTNLAPYERLAALFAAWNTDA